MPPATQIGYYPVSTQGSHALGDDRRAPWTVLPPKSLLWSQPPTRSSEIKSRALPGVSIRVFWWNLRLSNLALWLGKCKCRKKNTDPMCQEIRQFISYELEQPFLERQFCLNKYVSQVKTAYTPSDPFNLTPGTLSQQIISLPCPKGGICITPN